MLISRADIAVFLQHPISAFFIGLCVLPIAAQIYVRLHMFSRVLGCSCGSVGQPNTYQRFAVATI